ncbi:type II toxin-antitoxin system VapC family toxin [Halorubrum rutilum]|uniref:Ribonuclease VapC n=1 Tax=Halorubrum rutilum TaxID=1364933 RepID=A0ABD6AG52_9EURY|nr:PIN domain-containing protein [Halorubrum rutilum]
MDTNIILATVIDDSDTADVAATLLDTQSHDFVISALTTMELRAVLTKRERLPQDDVEAIITDLTRDVNVFIPDSGDFTTAVKLQRDTLLYPMDAMILACAEGANATLVSFDSELQEHGAVAPSEVPENGQ